MTTAKKFLILLGVFVIWLIYGATQYFKMDIKERSELHHKVGDKCGTIVSDFTELKNVKHGTRTDYFLLVRYPEGDVVESVSPKTFYTSTVGERICFGQYEFVGWGVVGFAFFWFLKELMLCMFIFGALAFWLLKDIDF